MGVKIFSIGKSGGTSVLILVCVEVSVGELCILVFMWMRQMVLILVCVEVSVGGLYNGLLHNNAVSLNPCLCGS